jgi:hypothetical protein
MAVTGALEDLDPGDLITVLGLLGKSGKLCLSHADSEGMVVFRHGKIIYAASSSFRQNLGSLLISRNLIDEPQLVAALERQSQSAGEERLGNILIDMGLITNEALEDVFRDQVSRVLSDFIPWSSGAFRFDAMEIVDHGEIELPADDLLAPLGLSTDHVLLEAAQRLDEESFDHETVESVDDRSHQTFDDAAVASVQEPEIDSVSLGSLVHEIHGPEFKGESLHTLMALAQGSFRRGILFSARKAKFRPTAHFGVEAETGLPHEAVPDFVVPRNLPGILRQSAETKRTVMAALPQGQGDDELLEALGGAPETKSVASPLIVRDEVVLVLYGDRIRDGLQTGWIEAIEKHLEELANAIQAEIEHELAKRPVTAETS